MKLNGWIIFLLLTIGYSSILGQSRDSIHTERSNVFIKYQDTINRLQYIRYNDKTIVFDSRGLFHFVKYLPSDMWQLAKTPFKVSSLKGLGIVAASTAILIPLDQYLLNKVRQASQSIGLDDENRYGVALGWGKIRLLKYPKNVNTALYQIGEGGTSMYLAGGLWIYGKLTHDYRAVQTAGDLAETFIVMGVSTQILKRISGRESPFVATKPGGAWRPLPSFKEYQSHVPHYDAFPSGHLATMMATVTVLNQNYPEKKWILPVGYSLIGLTAWGMMNTEVHWISDYPLALALGYVCGRISTMRHRKISEEGKKYLMIPEFTP